MKTLELRIWNFVQKSLNNVNKGHLLMLMFVLLTTVANAQNGAGFDQVGQNMWDQAGPIYKLVSVIVLLAGIFFFGKGIVEGLRGEQGAIVKIGGSLLVLGIWFFAVPPLINYLSGVVRNQNFNSF